MHFLRYNEVVLPTACYKLTVVWGQLQGRRMLWVRVLSSNHDHTTDDQAAGRLGFTLRQESARATVVFAAASALT